MCVSLIALVSAPGKFSSVKTLPADSNFSSTNCCNANIRTWMTFVLPGPRRPVISLGLSPEVAALGSPTSSSNHERRAKLSTPPQPKA